MWVHLHHKVLVMVAKYETGLNSKALFSWKAHFVLRLDYRLANRETVVPFPMKHAFI